MKQRTPPPPPGAPAPHPPGFVPIRGQHGTVYAYINPATRVIQFKRKGLAPEAIDLAEYLKS